MMPAPRVLIISLRGALLAATAMTSAALPALAVDVPGSVNPGQIEQRFREPESPRSNDIQPLPLPAPAAEIPANVRKQLEQTRFTLNKVNVEGATAFSPDEIEALYADKLGKPATLFDAQMIARAITDLYRRNGYILSQAIVPPQSISGGVLKIRVVEGFVADVIIQGDAENPRMQEIIRSYAAHIQESRPARMKDIERYLLLINDLPGADVQGLLRPSKSSFGAADLVLTVKQKTFDGSYAMDNRGSKFLGPWQHVASVGANSVLGLYERTQLRFITTSPTDEVKAFEVQHEELLGSNGTKLTVQAMHTVTKPGDSLKNLDIVGESDFVKAKVAHPFIRSRQENLVARVSIDARHTDTDVFHNVDFTDDRLRVVRAGGNYGFVDGLRGNTTVDGEISRGLNIFNASTTGTSRSNANGKSDFTKFAVDASRVQGLYGNFSLLTAMTGQYSLDPLLTSEQFSLGGAGFGQAYDPSELLGDHGVAGKVELRYGDALNDSLMRAYQFYSYYDLGRTWVRGGGPGANDKRSLASLGAGVRLDFSPHFSGNVEVAAPLTKPVNNQGGHADSPRLFMGANAYF